MKTPGAAHTEGIREKGLKTESGAQVRHHVPRQ